MPWLFVGVSVITAAAGASRSNAIGLDPFARQVAEQSARLVSESPGTRAGAAEALGFLRAYSAETALIERLGDASAQVRREAALALAWCGGRLAVEPLIATLDDRDPLTAQAAWVALTNLTGMEFPFDALADGVIRKAQVERWRTWWIEQPRDAPPRDVLILLGLDSESSYQRQVRGLRALGALGGRGAARAILNCIETLPTQSIDGQAEQVRVLRAGLRALGRLRDPVALSWLIKRLDETPWARYAAEVLGDFGDRRAVPALLAAYPHYARGIKGEEPQRVPKDDIARFLNYDRVFHTPFAIAFALSRLPLDKPSDQEALLRLVPRLLVDLPQDLDGAFLYEHESCPLVTSYLLDQAGMRQEACETAFVALGQPRRVPAPANAPPLSSIVLRKDSQVVNEPHAATWLPAFCRETEDVPRLIGLLDHPEGRVRLNAAKTLALLGDTRAIEPLAELLTAAKAEADYGYCGTFKFAEYNDPAPRFREGWIRALGMLGAGRHAPLLARVLWDERSVLEVRHAAAQALATMDEKPAVNALRRTASQHPFHSVRHVARESLWLRGDTESEVPVTGHDRRPSPACNASTVLPTEPSALVFIQGNNIIPNTTGTVEQADRWRQTYVVTDSGPAYRPGRNLYVLKPVDPTGTVTALTDFKDGYVAELEVSWDGQRVIFAHRGQDNPWWHIYQINADGTGLRQLTDGPYHDVGPAYLPDGRIIFSSTRHGVRDEYHGYPCTALHVMNADGSDIHAIAVNIGRDNEPTLLPDGRIAFSRLEVFYSRLKTELTLHAMHPDGTGDVVLYGPERRKFWRKRDVGPRTPAHTQEAPLTHRVLRITQPQGMPDGRIICATQGGLILVGPRRDGETIIPHDKMWAYTTPFPLPDGRILCAATYKATEKKDVDLGLYTVDVETGERTLIYNDPKHAEFEARPLMPRALPPTLAESPRSQSFTGRFVCLSTHTTQEPGVAQQGRLVRVVEGVPVPGRHSTHTNEREVWRNHHGTLARVLGTVPLAADGSFHLEVPADRLLHFQVLDSDRRVVGNQLTWISVRPGETRSCVGCHERPETTSVQRPRPQALQLPPVECLPTGDEFSYRAKAWFKGKLPPEVEERTRTVRGVNLLAR